MTGGADLGARIAGCVFLSLAVLSFTAARRFPDYSAKRGMSSLMASYGVFAFYASAAVLGLLGAWLILAHL